MNHTDNLHEEEIKQKKLAHLELENMLVLGSIDNLLTSQMQCPSIVDLADGKFTQTDLQLIRQAAPAVAGFNPVLAIKELELEEERFSKQARFQSKLSSLYYHVGNVGHAAQLATKAAAASPDNYYQHKLVEAYVASGNFGEAVGMLSTLAQQGDEQSSIKLASWYLANHNLEQCRASLSEVLERNPLSFRGRFLAGTVSLLDGQYDQAVHNYRVCTHNRPWHADSHFNLAIAHALNQYPYKAYEALRKAVTCAPMSLKIVTAFAELSYELKRHKHAIRFLRNYLKAYDNAYSLWGKLAAHYYCSGQFQLSKEALIKQSRGKVSAAIYNNLGCNESELNNIKTAKMHWSNAIALREGGYDHFLAGNNLLGTLFREQQWDKVISLGNDLINHPQAEIIGQHELLSDICFNTYAAYSETNHFNTGYELLEKLVEFASTNAYQLMARAYLISAGILEPGRLERSTQMIDDCLQEYYALEASLPEEVRYVILNNLCFALLELGRVEEAEPLIRRQDKYVGKGAYVTATKGLYFWKQGNVKKGIEFYRRAINLASNHYTATLLRQKLHLETGRMAMSDNDKSKAGNEFNKVIKLRKGSMQMVRMARYELSRLRGAG